MLQLALQFLQFSPVTRIMYHFCLALGACTNLAFIQVEPADVFLYALICMFREFGGIALENSLEFFLCVKRGEASCRRGFHSLW